MLSVAEARQRILTHFQPTATEIVPLIASANRALAKNIQATHDLPLFDNSSMDGFAVRAEDTHAALLTLSVVADIPAGSTPQVTLAPGQAARIMTGAPMPNGANAVIPVEDTDFDSRSAGTTAPQTVSFSKKVNVGEYVRPRGMDLRAGEIVLDSGRRLTAQDLGLLASLGIAQVEVHKKPRVALLSSGNELIPVDQPLESGKIYDSNTYMLTTLIQNAGAETLHLGTAKDTRESVAELLEKAVAEKADLILSSAGVSVGAFDFIKEVIELQGKMDFWRVNMRPGKPLAFGEYRGISFIGLPGNPVSAFVGFQVFVREALKKLSGASDGSRLGSGDAARSNVKVRCAEEITSDGRESYLRAILREENGVFSASLSGQQGSSNLLSLTQANALLIIPAGVKCVPAGQEVQAIFL
ncbi:MAG: molybdopterin molybdotransferase MoeA [Anaerolineales bacterium]|nr:molybdopterin molybdotransferase MoeA [Anaerolineales bacterium]